MSNEVAIKEQHPAFGMIGAYRISTSPPGKALFDSDILHQHSVKVQIETAERERDLNHDRIFGRSQIVEIEMSEAQWASFVSSMNTTGVPCTLTRIQGTAVDPVEYAPRLEASMRETREAAEEAFSDIKEAFAEYQEHPTKGNLRTLQARIDNAVPNVEFAGKSLSEHAENVVQKARADIEAIVTNHAARLGVEAPTTMALPAAPEEES